VFFLAACFIQVAPDGTHADLLTGLDPRLLAELDAFVGPAQGHLSSATHAGEAARGVRGVIEDSAVVDERAEPRSRGYFGGLTPSEAAARKGALARERRAERERDAADASLTAWQRFGVALSKLPQETLDAVVARLAADALAGDTRSVAALARLADQAFGRAQVEEEAHPEADPIEALTRAERSARSLTYS